MRKPVSELERRPLALQMNRALLYLVAAIPFLLGWICGFSVKAVKLFVAAVVLGYERGRHL